MGRVALWLAIISLVITAALFPLFSAVATFATTFLVLRLLAAVAGVAALALSLRARSSGRSSRHGTWALLLAGVGLFLNVMLILAIVIGVSLSRPSLTEVELRAKGGADDLRDLRRRCEDQRGRMAMGWLGAVQHGALGGRDHRHCA